MHWKIHIRSLALCTHFLFVYLCWIQKDLWVLLPYFIHTVANICTIAQSLLIQRHWALCFLNLVSGCLYISNVPKKFSLLCDDVYCTAFAPFSPGGIVKVKVHFRLFQLFVSVLERGWGYYLLYNYTI